VRRRSVVVLATCTVLLASCGGDAQTITSDGVTVLVSARVDGGMAALLPGTVGVVGGCLGVDDVVVVWPHGTEVVDEDPLTVDVPGSGGVGLGDEVALGGGHVLEHIPDDAPAEAWVGRTFDPDKPFRTGGVTVPRPCLEHGVFLAHE
jgi:hypothetical protein